MHIFDIKLFSFGNIKNLPRKHIYDILANLTLLVKKKANKNLFTYICMYICHLSTLPLPTISVLFGLIF
jgi:hypothetical protein